MGQNHPRRRMQTPDMIDQWNLDKSMKFYKDRFGDASDFTFVFVGSIDLATMKPLVERYLGSLPSIRRKTWKDVEARTPTGVIANGWRRHRPKSQTAMLFTGPFDTQEQRVAIRAMTEFCRTGCSRPFVRIWAAPTASPPFQLRAPSIDLHDLHRLRFRSSGSTISSRASTRDREVQGRGPTEAGDRRREALLRDFETKSKQNGYLVQQIMMRYQNNDDTAGLREVPQFYRKLDAATIQKAAKAYLAGSNRVQVTLVPEVK